MSRTQQVSDEVLMVDIVRPSTVTGTRIVDEFLGIHRGPPTDPVSGRLTKRPPVFGIRKHAFSSADVFNMVKTGNSDAVEFAGALTDIVAQATGHRIGLADLTFIVGTGTSLGQNGWLYSVQMSQPIEAMIRMVYNKDRNAWSYTIELLGGQVLTRKSDVSVAEIESREIDI